MTDTTGTAPVLLDVTENVATITLNRAEAMNSLDIATKESLRAVVEQVAADDTVRAVVLTGTGRAFCVGQDLKEHVRLLGDDPASLFTTVDEHYNPIVTALATMPKPVIAAVNGVAAGAGASLAFACDLRILAEGAGFNLAFPGVALSCDTGVSWTLQRLVGRAKAIELLYLPSTLSTQESMDLGLGTRRVSPEELMEQTQLLARRLAQGPTVAYASIRASVNHAAEHSFTEALEFESAMMQRTGATEDHRAAVDAFLRKERAVFHGR